MHQQHHFDIDRRPRKTQRFRAQLVELSVTPALRPLVPEHRAHVIQALAPGVGQVVLNGGAHHARRIFRAQSE